MSEKSVREITKEILVLKNDDALKARENYEAWLRLLITILGAAIVAILFQGWPLNNLFAAFAAAFLLIEIYARSKKIKVEHKYHRDVHKIILASFHAEIDYGVSIVDQYKKMLNELEDKESKFISEINKIDRWGNHAWCCVLLLGTAISWEFLKFFTNSIMFSNFEIFLFRWNVYLIQFIISIVIVCIYYIYSRKKFSNETDANQLI